MVATFCSTEALRLILADLNKLPLTPAIAAERAEVVRELNARKAHT